MTDLPDDASICNMAEFYAQALAIEIEASDRYRQSASRYDLASSQSQCFARAKGFERLLEVLDLDVMFLQRVTDLAGCSSPNSARPSLGFHPVFSMAWTSISLLSS